MEKNDRGGIIRLIVGIVLDKLAKDSDPIVSHTRGYPTAMVMQISWRFFRDLCTKRKYYHRHIDVLNQEKENYDWVSIWMLYLLSR